MGQASSQDQVHSPAISTAMQRGNKPPDAISATRLFEQRDESETTTDVTKGSPPGTITGHTTAESQDTADPVSAANNAKEGEEILTQDQADQTQRQALP